MEGEVTFDFYGVTARARGDCETLAHLARDFAFFHSSVDRPRIELTLHRRSPPRDSLPSLRSQSLSPRCAVYREHDVSWVSYYHGEALVRWSYGTESGELWSRAPRLLHELSYLLLLSRVGERLDAEGLHRLHACGVATPRGAALFVVPSGHGKSTLLRSALELPHVRLLSDDAPLITRSGKVLAFPIRIGLKARPPALDARYLRRFRRRDHGDKWLVDAEAFGPVPRGEIEPHAVVVGVRRLHGQAALTRVSRAQVVPELFRSGVIGLGLPQLVEYFLQGSPRDLVDKPWLAAKRSVALLSLLRRTRAFRFELSPDADENARVWRTFLLSLAAPQS